MKQNSNINTNSINNDCAIISDKHNKDEQNTEKTLSDYKTGCITDMLLHCYDDEDLQVLKKYIDCNIDDLLYVYNNDRDTQQVIDNNILISKDN